MIPLVSGDDSFKFLGMPMRVFHHNSLAKEGVKKSLEEMLVTVDNSLVIRQQKLHLFELDICPRLSWPLMVEVFPVSLGSPNTFNH